MRLYGHEGRVLHTASQTSNSWVQVLIPHSDEMYLSSLVVNAGKPPVYAAHHWNTAAASSVQADGLQESSV